MIKYNGVEYDESEIRGSPPPKIGEDIYIGSSWYLSHGIDDFRGGKCRVSCIKIETSAGRPTWFVGVEENPSSRYNWETLRKEQAKLKKEFGEERGRPEPDDDPDSNRWQQKLDHAYKKQ